MHISLWEQCVDIDFDQFGQDLSIISQKKHTSICLTMDIVAPASPAAVGWGATDAEPPFSIITMASNLLVKPVIAFS